MDSDPRPSSSPRKVRFAPKGPPRRKAKASEAKRETADQGDNEDDDEINESLLRKVNDHLTRRHPKAEKKSSVQVAFSHGVASSTSIRTYGVRKEGTSEITGKGSRDSALNDEQDLLALPPRDGTDGILEDSENAVDPLFKKKKKKDYKEPWDYHHSYYPITLPLRRPFSGDPEILDKEEFGAAASAIEYDENAIHSASDLGLLGEGDAAKMLFFQLPANIPYGELPNDEDKTEASDSIIQLPGEDVPARAKDKAIAGSSSLRGLVASPTAKGKEATSHISKVSASREGKRIGDGSKSFMRNASNKVCSLEELPAGCIGKMLVYKSGAVKLKIGDIQYDVSPGSDCVFAQDIMTLNTAEKHCCSLGELKKRVVVAPDIDSLLDPVILLE